MQWRCSNHIYFCSTSFPTTPHHSHFVCCCQQEEAQYQEQATRRKARSMGSDSATAAAAAPQGMKFWGSKVFTSSRWQAPTDHGNPGISEPAAAPSQPGAADLDSLYDGYFRGLFPNGSLIPNPHHNPSLENVHVWRFVEGRTNSMARRHLRLGGEYSNFEEPFGPQLNSNTTGFEALGGRGEYPTYESVSRNGSSSRSSSSSDTRDALEAYVAARHEEGVSSRDPRTRPVPTTFSSGVSLRRAQSSLSQDESNAPGPSVLFSRPGGDDGDSVVTGGLSGRGGGDIHVDGIDVRSQDEQSGQILGGLKHRLLSFILQCIQNDDTTPAIVRCSCRCTFCLFVWF